MTFWSVAQIYINRESYVAGRITDAGFEVFAPKTRIRVKGTFRVVALFPGYAFVRIVDRWRAVAKTPGVLGLVMSGEQPAQCPDIEVEKIRAAMRNGLVQLPKMPQRAKPRPFKVGQNIRVLTGSFTGFDAVYAGMSTRDRQLVLLTMFGRQTRVELATIDEIVGAESCAQNQSGVRGFRGEKIESPRRAARALQAAIKA
jgi:transcription antitermination factor NusG